MSRAGIEQLLWLMDQAFDSPEPPYEHSLLANLRSLTIDDWHWLPPGGDRPIFQIAVHIGACKFVYENHAFGDGSMRWDVPRSIPGIGRGATPPEILDYLREGHATLRRSVAALADDEELTRPRKANWGEEYETRWLIKTMIEHDLYHGGEINHIRSQHQENDRWEWLQDNDE